jgi:hypothetical protein
MEILAKPRNKLQFQRRTKVKFCFDAKAENVRANRIQVQTTQELSAVKQPSLHCASRKGKWDRAYFAVHPYCRRD